MITGITGFIRVPDSLDPNKVYALGSNGRPINNEQDLMTLTGGKTVAQAWQLANVQNVSPEDALNKYNVTAANAKRAGGSTTSTVINNTQNNQQTTTTNQSTVTSNPAPETTQGSVEEKVRGYYEAQGWDTADINRLIGERVVEYGWGKALKENVDNYWAEKTAPPASTATTGQKPYIRNPLTNDVYDRNNNKITAEQAANIPNFWDNVEVIDTAPATGGNVPGGDTTAYNTGNTDLDTMLNAFLDTLKAITDAGKVVNPNIDITPELTKQWLDQASTELDPYYQSQFSAIKGDLSTDLNYLSDQYKSVAKTNEETFKQNLATSRENAANSGTIFSGARGVNEQSLADTSQRNMEGLSGDLTYKAQKTGNVAEQNIGSTNLSGLNSPTYKSYSMSTLGEGQYIPLSDRSLFNPTGGVTGTLERTQIEKKRAYQDLLKGNWLAGQNV